MLTVSKALLMSRDTSTVLCGVSDSIDVYLYDVELSEVELF